MSSTPIRGITDITESQAGASTIWAEAMRLLEVFSNHVIVESTALTTPPGSPAEGDAYLVATGGTGAWDDQDGKIAYYTNGGWKFATLRIGTTLYNLSNNTLYVYKNTGLTAV